MIDKYDYPTKLDLPNVELNIVDCIDHQRAVNVINHCLSQARFGDVKYLTHFQFNHPHTVWIPKLNSIFEYSRFMIRELYKYINLDYVLTIQYDGFIVNKDKWTNEFLDYDYIGALWHPTQLGLGIPKEHCVGNGGFSLRSKRLLKILAEDERFNFSSLQDYVPEDAVICQRFRPYLESLGIRFAPIELAHRFANENYPWDNSFGQHNQFLLKDKSNSKFKGGL